MFPACVALVPVACVCFQGSLKEAHAQVSQLQQKEKERETRSEKEQERERDRQHSELEKMLQVLVDRGLIRMERSESGSLDLHIIPAANTTGKDKIYT